jgi:hypothetical protein
LIDDAEREDGRINLDTMLINSTDAGTDPSQMLFTRTLRKHGHAISVIARMSPKETPFADLVVPLTRGAVELADVSPHSKEFDSPSAVTGATESSLIVMGHAGQAGIPPLSPAMPSGERYEFHSTHSSPRIPSHHCLCVI